MVIRFLYKHPKPKKTILKEHLNWVGCVRVQQNDQNFLSVSCDQSIIIWDLNEGVCIRKIFNVHSGAIRWFALTKDEKTVYTVSYDQTYKVVDLETGKGKQIEAHDNCVTCCALTHNEKYF
eukprot:UN02463